MVRFKNCNVIYFDTDTLYVHKNSLKDLIVVSCSETISKECYIHGIIHVHSTSVLPNEDIDCIITNNIQKMLDLVKRDQKPSSIICIKDTGDYSHFCYACQKIYKLNDLNIIDKYCSDKCAKRYEGVNIMKKLETNELILGFDKNLSVEKELSIAKKSVDKFQTSMVKDAIRLEYAFKREKYKQEMRQPSYRKTNITDKKKTSALKENVCKGITKKGKTCTNKTLPGSLYCGILSHGIINEET